ncbi:MAG: hypothetical protein J6I56_08935, partial [Lachnospiraceae bacterium]|nr:hypothetical protein [Lachnospiraceae bacterium]
AVGCQGNRPRMLKSLKTGQGTTSSLPPAFWAYTLFLLFCHHRNGDRFPKNSAYAQIKPFSPFLDGDRFQKMRYIPKPTPYKSESPLSTPEFYPVGNCFFIPMLSADSIDSGFLEIYGFNRYFSVVSNRPL